MDTSESKVHSFIVKIWLEEVGDETENAFWRGHITHVPSGERRYLKGLSDISDFIERYLAALEAEPARSPSLRRFVSRLSFRKSRRFTNR
jgi:hypothetical protein